jgi:hypothetical protein
MADLPDVAWRKSTRSGLDGCVEVGFLAEGDRVMVRHSKDRAGPVLTFAAAEWQSFVVGAAKGEFDLPA